MKKIFSLSLAVCLLASCTQEHDAVFDKDSSIRLTEYLEQVEQTLTAGSRTWVLEMYPGAEHEYGGYAFTLRFTPDSVYCGAEISEDLTREVGSLWRISRDCGPVLTFDTYNDLMHYFATPSSQLYQAYNGEFEWIINEVEPDLITLRGKKSGNIVYLRRLNTTPTAYLQSVRESTETLSVVGLKGEVGKGTVTATYDASNRQITFEPEGEEPVQSAFAVTPEGIRLYAPVVLHGETITSLTYQCDSYGAITQMLTDSGEALTPVLPQGYRPYLDYVGSYTLSYLTYRMDARGSYVVDLPTEAQVEILEGDGKNTLLLRNLNPKADIELTYNRTRGVIEIRSQHLGNVGDCMIYLCAWGLEQGGLLTAAPEIGMMSQWNGDTEHPAYTFVDNGATAGFTTDSFVLYLFSLDGEGMGPSSDRGWMFRGASRITTTDGRFLGTRLPYFNKAVLTKN